MSYFLLLPNISHCANILKYSSFYRNLEFLNHLSRLIVLLTFLFSEDV